jgi:hypothetical protein
MISTSQVCFFLLSLCLATYIPNLTPPPSNATNIDNDPSDVFAVSGSDYSMPPKWSSFYWNATGSWQGIGKIRNQILYPFRVLNDKCDNFIAVDTVNQQFKMNFTCGGMQKTNTSGTWLTFAPGGQCWFISRWTYEAQIKAYTYATMKRKINDNVGMWTGDVEDVSSCFTTVATTLVTRKGRVIEWDFTGGFKVAGLGSVMFDYQLTYNTISDGVPPLTNTQYWDIDASCKAPNVVSNTICHDVFPEGCSTFLAGYKPLGSATPDCNCTNC